jgi:hypothetical protein
MGATDRIKMRHAWSVTSKIIGAGALLALLVSVSILLYKMHFNPSSLEAFNRIELTMPREQVVSILRSTAKISGCSGSQSNRENVCEFSDFWRVYTVIVDPSTDLVIEKRFYFRTREQIESGERR